VAHVNGRILSVGRARVVVDGRLHLLQHVVDLLEVLLGAQIGHRRQIVVLGKRAMRGATDTTKGVRSLRHVLGSETATSMQAERRMQRHQGTADLRVRTRVDLGALNVAEEIVQGLDVGLPAIVEARGLVADVVGARAAHGMRVVHGGVVRRLGGLLLLAVVARLAVLVRVTKVARVGSAHMAIVIIEAAGRLVARVRAVAGVHAARLVLRGATGDEHRVVGMGLDVLLEILGPLERLAAEVALMRLQRHVDADVRGDVVALDRGGAALVPLADQVEVVGALATDMLLTDVVLVEVSDRSFFPSFFSFSFSFFFLSFFLFPLFFAMNFNFVSDRLT
jgi:hypothetical protein